MNAAYTVFLTILLASGHPHTTQHACPDLVCVAYLVVAGNEGRGLARVRVVRGDAGPLPGSGKRTIFPPFLDEEYL